MYRKVIAESYGSRCMLNLRNFQIISVVAVLFCIPSTIHESFICSAFLPALGIVHIYFSYSNTCVVIFILFGIYISLMVLEGKELFMCLFAIFRSSVVHCLSPFLIFKLDCLFSS